MIRFHTCSDKRKTFEWEIKEDTVIIHRKFKSGYRKDIVSLKDFDKINEYALQKGSIILANNVEKMANHTEVDGIGTFLIRNCSYKSSDAQIASQIAAILCQVGIWTHNNKKRNIEFYSHTTDCSSVILEYFNQSLAY